MDTQREKILIVDDNSDHADLAVRAISKFQEYDIEIAVSAAECEDLIRRNFYEVVILDYYLGDTDGTEVLRQIKKSNKDTQVIVVTGLGNERIAVEAIKAGAFDYIVKSSGYLEFLPVILEKALNFYRECIHHRETEKIVSDMEEQFIELVENINVGIFRIRGMQEDSFISINNALVKIFGYDSKEELMKEHLEEHFCDEESKKDFVKNIVTDGQVKEYELEMFKKNGSKIWVSISAKRHVEAGDVKWVDGTVEDITERKRIKMELEENLFAMKMILKDTIKILAATSDMRDPFTAGHQKRVAKLSEAIAREMGLSEDAVEEINMASMVHDIGKINIPIEILSNPRRLTKLEYDMVKTHPKVGYDILISIKAKWAIADIIAQHHERLDGSGYPMGLKGDDILTGARILAIADVVEAMSSHRPYRPAFPLKDAIREIEDNKGTLYDPEAAKTLVSVMNKGFTFDI